MTLTADQLRLILGLKLKSLRHSKGQSLSELARQSGTSLSYLSEIENGRKYPKPEILLRLAEALHVDFDTLSSTHLEGELDGLEPLLRSDFLQEFPFDLFGVDVAQLLGMVSGDPLRAAAFIQTFLEIGRAYDVHVEQFLFAALRSYQRLHDNYFPELENAAVETRTRWGWTRQSPEEGALRTALEKEFGVQIDDQTLGTTPELSDLRSAYSRGTPPRLWVHPGLTSAQRAFVFGRELGFQVLGLSPRPDTSSWVRIGSFEEILNHFKASYFAGALLMPEEEVVGALEPFFFRKTWSAPGYLALMQRFSVTPETFAYRLSQLLPSRLGLSRLYFMRFQSSSGSSEYHLTKVLNLSGTATPRAVGSREHYCRRWSALQMLRDLEGRGPNPGNGQERPPQIRGERAYFLPEDREFFLISAARPLSVREGGHSCVTLGLLMDDAFRERVGFWNDPNLRRNEVGLTCERCPLSAEACEVRAAPPSILERDLTRERRVQALQTLLALP